MPTKKVATRATGSAEPAAKMTATSKLTPEQDRRWVQQAEKILALHAELTELMADLDEMRTLGR